ncbi:MAG: signal peptide peptidase SppA [Singulisphaera sp.]
MSADDLSQRPGSYAPLPPVSERVIVAAPQRSRLSSLVSLLFFVFLVLPGILLALLLVGAMFSLSGGAESHVQEHYHSLSKTATNKIAIINVSGAIIEPEGFVKKQIDQVRADKEVKAVVLRVNSPGGTVTASDYLYHHLREMLAERKIPMVVSMGGIAASGGYYIAMAVGDGENVVFAEPTTWTGSIGVIIPHYNIAGLMKSWDIAEDSIKSGPLKQMGTPTRAMTDEERAIFQDLVDDSFKRFQDIVKAGRPKLAADADALAKVTTGQVFTTNQALANGLVDEEGYIEQAIERAVELAGLSTSNARAVRYQSRGGLFSMPFAAEARPALDLASLVDLASPRAYFLCTWQLPLSAQAQ